MRASFIVLINFYVLTSLLLGLLSGCGGDWNRLFVTGLNMPASKEFSVQEIEFTSSQLILRGQNLHQITQVILNSSEENLSETFVIEEQTTTELRARPTSHLELAVNAFFSLLLSNANAQETYSITFNLDGQKINTLQLETTSTISAGQILRWDGENWVPGDLSGLTYGGTWDADLNIPNLLTFPGGPGHFFIVSHAGTTNLDGITTWSTGDWAILNEDLDWERVPAAGGVKSFAGRVGDVLPMAGDYELADLDDVITAGALDGQVLKYDAATQTWLPADDETTPPGSGVTNIATGTGLTGGPITDTGTISIAPLGVDTAQIANGAINADKLASDAVTTIKIDNSAVTADKLATNAVTNIKIENGAVSHHKIADNAVRDNHIQDNAVITAKINNGAVTADKLANNAVITDKINNAAVTHHKIADNAVRDNHIQDNAVITAKINNGAVTNAKIATGTITMNRLDTTGIVSASTFLRGDGVWGNPNAQVQTCEVNDHLVWSSNPLYGSIAPISPAPIPSSCRYLRQGNIVHFELYARFHSAVAVTLENIRLPLLRTSTAGGACLPGEYAFATLKGYITANNNGGGNHYPLVVTHRVHTEGDVIPSNCNVSNFIRVYSDPASHFLYSGNHSATGGQIHLSGSYIYAGP